MEDGLCEDTTASYWAAYLYNPSLACLIRDGFGHKFRFSEVPPVTGGLRKTEYTSDRCLSGIDDVTEILLNTCVGNKRYQVDGTPGTLKV